MVSFEIFVKAMPPSLSKLKVLPSFCFSFKIPDDRAVTNVYSFFILYSFFNLNFLQNGETCLHAATISGNPELVQLLLEKTTTDDALLTNASGQNPLDLLIMFINYGNISLTSNLLKVRVLELLSFKSLK